MTSRKRGGVGYELDLGKKSGSVGSMAEKRIHRLIDFQAEQERRGMFWDDAFLFGSRSKTGSDEENAMRR